MSIVMEIKLLARVESLSMLLHSAHCVYIIVHFCLCLKLPRKLLENNGMYIIGAGRRIFGRNARNHRIE